MATDIPIDIQALPEKPGGGNWRPVEILVAWLRVNGETWEAVAEATPYKQDTVQKYTQREWWPLAYSVCSKVYLAEREDDRLERQAEKRQEFQDKEDRLVQEGIVLALETLVDTMKGERLRDEQGNEITDYEGNPRVPSHQTRAIAAKTLLQMVGYKRAKDDLAALAVERQRAAAKLEESNRAQAIDVSIMGVDEGGAE